MADASAQEAAFAQAMVPEGARPSATLTPGQELAHHRGRLIRQAVKEGDPQAAIRETFHANDRERDLGFDSQVNLKSRLGSNEPQPGDKNMPQYTEAKKILTASQDLVEGRLKKGDPGYDLIRTDIMTRLNMKGRGFDGLSTSQKLAKAEAMIEDPLYQAKLRDVMRTTVGEERDVDGQIKKAEQAFQEAQDLYITKNSDATDATDEYNKVDTQLTTEYDGIKGTKTKRIKSLERDGYDEDGLYDQPISEIYILKAKTRITPKSPAEMNKLIVAARIAVKDGSATDDQKILLDIVKDKKNREEYLSLTDERATLEQKKKELEERKDQLAKEAKDLKAQRDARQTEKDDLSSTDKIRQDKVLLDSARAVVAEAAEKYIDDDVEKMIPVWEEMIKKEEAAATSRDAKVVEGFGLKKEVFKSGKIFNRGGKIVTEANRDDVNNAAKEFTKNKMKYLGDLLKEEYQDITTGSSPDSPEELARKKLERDRIDQKLASDPQFVKDSLSHIAVEIVRAKVIASRFYETGRLTSEQGSAMLNDPDIREAVTAELIKKAHEIEGVTGRTGLAAGVDRLARGKDEHGLLYALALLVGAPMVFAGKQIAH